MTRCSSDHTSDVSSSMKRSCCRAMVVAMARVSSYGVAGCSRPDSIRRRTACVSRSGISGGTAGIHRAVHGDHVARTDEQVELDVVDVPVPSAFGRVHDDEDMVVVRMDARYAIAFDAVTNGQRMKAEDVT